MEEKKLRIIGKTLADLSGIPCRLYKKDVLLEANEQTPFEPNPIMPHIKKILGLNKLVNLYATELFLFYGSVKYEDYTFVCGPISRIKLDDYQLRHILSEIGEPQTRIKELEHYFSVIPIATEVVFFTRLLCGLNIFLNETEVNVTDVTEVNPFIEKQDVAKIYKGLQTHEDDTFIETDSIQSGYEYEKMLMDLIATGQPQKIAELKNHSAATFTVGKLAFDNLRQIKNMLICSTTLAARAAIKGGLEVGQSFRLADTYIQAIEKAYSFDGLTKLSKQMTMDYATRVRDLHYGNGNSPIVNKVKHFVAQNLSTKFSVEDIAEKFNVSRSYLSTKFKKETGMSITDYIINQRIIEAQRLLKFTDKTLAQISYYLCFTSQSYFQTMFKRVTGCTPNEYRNNNRN